MISQYDVCLGELGADAADRALLECVTTRLESTRDDHIKDILLVYASALVFFMQAGFAMICAGAVRQKNVQNTSTFLCFYVVASVPLPRRQRFRRVPLTRFFTYPLLLLLPLLQC
jgi:Ammonium Transporter Family